MTAVRAACLAARTATQLQGVRARRQRDIEGRAIAGSFAKCLEGVADGSANYILRIVNRIDYAIHGVCSYSLKFSPNRKIRRVLRRIRLKNR